MEQLNDPCGKCGGNADEHKQRETKYDDLYQQPRISIQCDGCNVWYHLGCADLEEYEVENIDRYYCEKCAAKTGPTIKKMVVNTHRNDGFDANADKKPVECGTNDFVKHLRTRNDFLNVSSIIADFENGLNLDVKYLETTSFDKPILIHKTSGLEMRIPEIENIDHFEHIIDDPLVVVDVIDSQRQKDYKMKLSTFLKFYRQKHRERIYNIISFEFSGTKLSPLISLPKIVKDISWIHQYWPKSLDKACVLLDEQKPIYSALLNDHFGCKPEVAKFCLISMRDSYTDFHIDFGGSSVWYHVLWGEKVFYLIEPTESNLALYDDWMRALNKSERFLADEVTKCYAIHLKAGQTFFIPTGWIHAVLTLNDSLVFGGNFLHSFNIGLQLKVHEMELGCAMYEKYMFPNYELVNWYAAYYLLDFVRELNDEKQILKRYLNTGLKALIDHMKLWLDKNKSRKRNGRDFVEKIESISVVQLVNRLEKALRTNEKLHEEQRLKRALKLSSYAKKRQEKRNSSGVIPKCAQYLTASYDKSPKSEQLLLDFDAKSPRASSNEGKSGVQENVLLFDLNEHSDDNLRPILEKSDGKEERLRIDHCAASSQTKSLSNQPSTFLIKRSESPAATEKSNLKLKLSLKISQMSKCASDSQFDDNIQQRFDLKEEPKMNPPAAKIDQKADLGSIFGVSKRGRVQKISPSLLNNTDFRLHDSDDDDNDAVGMTKKKPKKRPAFVTSLLPISDFEPSSNESDLDFDEKHQLPKMKKKKPKTVKQRLALKLKLK